MDLTLDLDGGATLRLTSGELVAYYNLLNGFLQETTTWADGSPIPAEVIYRQRVQLHQLAIAIGLTDVQHPDDE